MFSHEKMIFNTIILIKYKLPLLRPFFAIILFFIKHTLHHQEYLYYFVLRDWIINLLKDIVLHGMRSIFFTPII